MKIPLETNTSVLPQRPSKEPNEELPRFHDADEAWPLRKSSTASSATSESSSPSFHSKVVAECKDACVQTEISTFPQDSSAFKGTWIKVYTPSDFEDDSGLQSLVGSPLLESANQPLSVKTLMDDRFGKEFNRTIAPPPGFGWPDSSNMNFMKDAAPEEKLNHDLLPWGLPVSNRYSLFTDDKTKTEPEVPNKLIIGSYVSDDFINQHYFNRYIFK